MAGEVSSIRRYSLILASLAVREVMFILLQKSFELIEEYVFEYFKSNYMRVSSRLQLPFCT